jgi:hypothetical protein
LDAREKRLKKSLGTASVISWARANTARLVSQDLDGVHLEGFVHALTHIRLGMLKRVLPDNCLTYAGEIVQVFFEEVKPGPGNDYKEHPTIKTFLDETSLDPLSSDKRFRVDYRESTEVYSVIVQAKNWFGRGEVRCPDHSQVEAIFRSEHVNHRQESTLGSASVISFACTAPSGPESAAANTVQVEVLVIGTSNIRRSTLESWLDPAIHPQIVQFEWSAVKTGRGKPYFRDPTVKQFLEESALDPTVSGKRPRVDLCGPSGASPKKVGRKPGSIKPRPGHATDTAAGGLIAAATDAAGGPPAAAAGGSGHCGGRGRPSACGGPPALGVGRGRGGGRGGSGSSADVVGAAGGLAAAADTPPRAVPRRGLSDY